jgi:hypothetical protein
VIVTDDGVAQGAMLISAQPVASEVSRDSRALILERLFTAPRNRPNLRRDGKPFFVGVGVELLKLAARLSVDQGSHGRLLLEASPDAVEWYERRGLKRLRRKPTLFEGTEYLWMLLESGAAQRLLLRTEE